MIRMRNKADPPFFWNANRKQDGIHSIHNFGDDEFSKSNLHTPKSTRDGSRNAAKAGLKSGWIRATLIVREDNLKKLKEFAYWSRKDLKQVADEALSEYLDRHKIVNNDIRPQNNS